MQFFSLTTLAFGLLSTITVSALPKNPAFLETRNATCTPGQSFCAVCQPHTDGYPPNCVATCNDEGTLVTITKQCSTVCTTECPFSGCPLVCS